MKLIVPLIVALIVGALAFSGGTFTGNHLSQESVDDAQNQTKSADKRAKAADGRAVKAAAKAVKAELRETAALETAKNLNITTRRLLMQERQVPQPDKKSTDAFGDRLKKLKRQAATGYVNPDEPTIAAKPDGVDRYCLICKDTHPTRQHVLPQQLD